MSFAEQQGSSKHAVGFLFVVLLHVGVVYALVTGLGRQVIEVIHRPIETKIIDESRPPPPDVLPPPLPKLAAPPPPYIPAPEIRIQQPAPQNAISAVTTVKPPEAAPPPAVRAAEPVHVPPVIDAARACKQPEYPSASRRLEETGAVILQFLIDVDGSVVESKVATSSGHARLDEAALEALSRCRFKAGTVDGKPEQSWARLRYIWKLE